jgi:hypothetical protein
MILLFHSNIDSGVANRAPFLFVQPCRQTICVEAVFAHVNHFYFVPILKVFETNHALVFCQTWLRKDQGEIRLIVGLPSDFWNFVDLFLFQAFRNFPKVIFEL